MRRLFVKIKRSHFGPILDPFGPQTPEQDFPNKSGSVNFLFRFPLTSLKKPVINFCERLQRKTPDKRTKERKVFRRTFTSWVQ